MKKLIVLVPVFFNCILIFAQFDSPKTKCPPPKYKKGQTSAQVNEDTRIYIECVKEFKQQQAEARREANLEAEKRKAEKHQQQAAERERNQHNRELDRQKREEERQKREQERRDQRERERQKREAAEQNQPEVQG